MNTVPDAAYQGTRGAFSEVAAWQMLSDSADLKPCLRLHDVFDAVEKGEVRYGVIPWKNTLAAVIRGSLDLLVEHAELSIVGETAVLVEHAIVGLRGSRLEQIRKIYSHPVALAQCERFFLTHPEIQPWFDWDTAGAVAKVVRENLEDSAAIAGARTAEIYQGEVLAERIQDDPDNYTRFKLISRELHSGEIDGLAKTTVVFFLENRSREIYNAIKPFAERDLNIPEIDNRQVKGAPFTYRFYLDFESLPDQRQALQDAIVELQKNHMKFRVLGTYPAFGYPSKREEI